MSKQNYRAGHRRLRKDLVGWKKARGPKGGQVLLELRIPKGSRVYVGKNDHTAKHRADRAKVIRAWGIKFNDNLYSCSYSVREEPMSERTRFGPILKSNIDLVVNGKRSSTYKIGDLIEPLNSFAMYDETCASGIHFFIDRRRAVDYR